MSEKDDDEARKIVLARRARFVAAAVAGVGVACRNPSAEACLSPPPEPCLSVVPDRRPVDAGATGSTGTPPEVPPAEPQVCLKVRATPPDEDAGPKPSPAPCLSVVAPKPPPKPKPSP